MQIVLFLVMLMCFVFGFAIGAVLEAAKTVDIPTIGKLILFLPNKDLYFCLNDKEVMIDLDSHKQVLVDVIVEDTIKQEKHPL